MNSKKNYAEVVREERSRCKITAPEEVRACTISLETPGFKDLFANIDIKSKYDGLTK